MRENDLVAPRSIVAILAGTVAILFVAILVYLLIRGG